MVPIPLCVTMITVVATAVAGKEILKDKQQRFFSYVLLEIAINFVFKKQ